MTLLMHITTLLDAVMSAKSSTSRYINAKSVDLEMKDARKHNSCYLSTNICFCYASYEV